MVKYIKIAIITFLGFTLVVKANSQSKYVSDPAWFKTYDIKFYWINLDITDTSTFIGGNTVVKLEIKQPTDSIVFNFNPDLVIDSVTVNAIKADSFFFRNDLLIIGPGKKYAEGEKPEANIFYHGKIKSNSFFSSLSSEKDYTWDIPVTWTLSEPFGAKIWFPCKQQLTDKADSCWLFLNVPKGLKAGAPGILTDTVSMGTKTQFQWKTRYPVAFYLISFSVADYNDYSFYVKFPGRTDSLLVQNFIYDRKDFLAPNKADIDRTADFLRLYSKLFGLYPFYAEKYGHCIAPMGGGMEHQTMTTLFNFSFPLVSHELAHQWFGDHTTCSSWQDIWVNEGFASYCEYLAYEFLESPAEAGYWLSNAQGRALREPEGSVFVPAGEAFNELRIFSSNLSYKKGGAIIHMLRKQVNNDSLFFRSVRKYLATFPYGNASGDDFKKVMEEETGMDLDTFFNQWYYGKGFPQFDISWKYSHDSVFVNIKQTTSSGSTPFFSTPFDLKIAGAGFDSTYRLNFTANFRNYSFRVPAEVINVEFDPENWLLKKITSVARLPELPSNDDYFDVSPNPFAAELTIVFKTESAKNEKIQILNMNGSVVRETIVKRKKEYELNTSDLPEGTYLLVVSHDTHKYVRKIVKASNF